MKSRGDVQEVRTGVHVFQFRRIDGYKDEERDHTALLVIISLQSTPTHPKIVQRLTVVDLYWQFTKIDHSQNLKTPRVIHYREFLMVKLFTTP